MKERLLRFTWQLGTTPFGKTLLVFIAAQLLFLLFLFFARFQFVRDTPFVKHRVLPQGIERAQTAFFIVCIHLLVAVNTAIFIKHSLKPHRHFGKLKPELQATVDHNYHRFVSALIASVVISTVIMTVIVAGNCFSVSEQWWTWLLTLNEILSILLFAVFLLADQWCLEACRVALREDSALDQEGRRELEPFNSDLKVYMLACDGPGLFGLVLIAILSLALHPVLAGYYWQGFVTGAIGIHIAFSQSALAFLSTQGNSH